MLLSGSDLESIGSRARTGDERGGAGAERPLSRADRGPPVKSHVGPRAGVCPLSRHGTGSRRFGPSRAAPLSTGRSRPAIRAIRWLPPSRAGTLGEHVLPTALQRRQERGSAWPRSPALAVELRDARTPHRLRQARAGDLVGPVPRPDPRPAALSRPQPARSACDRQHAQRARLPLHSAGPHLRRRGSQPRHAHTAVARPGRGWGRESGPHGGGVAPGVAVAPLPPPPLGRSRAPRRVWAGPLLSPLRSDRHRGLTAECARSDGEVRNTLLGPDRASSRPPTLASPILAALTGATALLGLIIADHVLLVCIPEPAYGVPQSPQTLGFHIDTGGFDPNGQKLHRSDKRALPFVDKPRRCAHTVVSGSDERNAGLLLSIRANSL